MLQLLNYENKEKESLTSLFSPFKTISLEKTNELAQMLSRVDNKYVVDFKQFKTFLSMLSKDYAIMEIKDRIQFSYSSCYYDDAKFSTYFAHHQGRRNRFKVRTREYVDSHLIFFETKFKGARGLCNKHRIKTDELIMPRISDQYQDLLQEKHQHYYHKQSDLILKPSLIVKYKRCTLVALKGGERVTVDFNLEFSNPNDNKNPIKIGDNFIIIETKSADGKGFADKSFRQLKIRQAQKCSKYCLGLNLTNGVTKNNRFLSTIKHIKKNIINSIDNKIQDVPNFVHSQLMETAQ